MSGDTCNTGYICNIGDTCNTGDICNTEDTCTAGDTCNTGDICNAETDRVCDRPIAGDANTSKKSGT